MARSEQVLLSRPHRVVFAGFESTTTRLQQAGWQLAVEQDIRSGRLGLLMKLESARLHMFARELRLDFFRHAQESRYGEGPELLFEIQHCSSTITAMVNANLGNFRQIDAEPQFATVERKRIEDFNIFATPLVRTEEIVIEPSSVTECLDLIRRLQAPALTEVRQRNRQRDRDEGEPMPRANFHAQVLSLVA